MQFHRVAELALQHMADRVAGRGAPLHGRGCAPGGLLLLSSEGDLAVRCTTSRMVWASQHEVQGEASGIDAKGALKGLEA